LVRAAFRRWHPQDRYRQQAGSYRFALRPNQWAQKSPTQWSGFFIPEAVLI